MSSTPRSHLHVDIVFNDFGHAAHVKVARCGINGTGELAVWPDGVDGERVRPVVDEAIARLQGGPDDRLHDLHTVLQGDYVFATEAHDDQACPFSQGPVVSMTPVATRTDHVAGASR